MKLREVEDNSDYYCFSYFHPNEIYVGQGLIFINKLDKRFFVYGSGNSDSKKDFIEKIALEKSVRNVYPEFDILKRYNVKIDRILRKMYLIEKLLELNFTFTIPEIVGSDIFRIPKLYNQKILEERLSQLPCEFTNLTAENVCEIFLLNKNKKTVEFSITEYFNTVKVSRVEIAKDSDLQTSW